MITGTAERVRSALQTSVPLMPGSIRSSSTMSAPLRSNSSSASWPVRRDRGGEALLAQQEGQRVGEGLLVLDDQHPGHCPPCQLGEIAGVVTLVGAGVCRCSAAGSDRSSASDCGSRRVKVEPVPGLLHSRDVAAVVGRTCLTMARPSPVPPVARDRAGSTRKNRSNTRFWCSGAMPMPRSVTRDLDRSRPRAGGDDRHRRVRRRVGDGVVEQVRQRGDQQRPVAVAPAGRSACRR